MPAIAVALFACGACLALVLNQYWLSDAQEELLTEAQSAALAGALQLASDDRLKPDYDPGEAAARARLAALDQSGKHAVSGRKTSDLEVHLGRVEIDPLTGRQDAIETDDNPTNVVVIGRRDQRHGNPVGMIAPAFTGSPTANVTVTTEASLCNLISGVRPVGAGRVPAWPIAILENSVDERLPCWFRQIEQRQGGDQYGWDALNHVVTDEPDGLPELELFSGKEGEPGNLCLVNFGNQLQEDRLDRQIRDGLSQEDLIPFNGEITLIGEPVPFAALANLNRISPELLRENIGQVRIVPLYTQLKSTGRDAWEADLHRLVAIRLMAVKTEEESVRLIVQPAVIATRTAVIDQEALYRGETEGNPYIFKISLTQ